LIKTLRNWLNLSLASPKNGRFVSVCVFSLERKTKEKKKLKVMGGEEDQDQKIQKHNCFLNKLKKALNV